MMIYSHKPQRSGRHITANTNNPPQDPPPPPPKLIGLDDDVPKVSYEIPDIPIENTTPPVPEPCINEKLIIATPTKIIPKQQSQKQKPKTISKRKTITEKPQKEIPPPEVSLFKRFLAKIKSIFRRK